MLVENLEITVRVTNLNSCAAILVDSFESYHMQPLGSMMDSKGVPAEEFSKDNREQL